MRARGWRGTLRCVSDDSSSDPISRPRGTAGGPDPSRTDPEDDAILDAEDPADDLVELRRRLTAPEPADEAPAPTDIGGLQCEIDR